MSQGTILRWSGDLDWVGVFTIALAAATVWLAWATRALAKGARQELEHSQRPVVAPTAIVNLDLMDKQHPEKAAFPGSPSRITLRTVGVGPALNIELELTDPDDATTFPTRVAALGAGVERRLGLPLLATRFLELEISYDDIAQKRYVTTARWSPVEKHWLEIEAAS